MSDEAIESLREVHFISHEDGGCTVGVSELQPVWEQALGLPSREEVTGVRLNAAERWRLGRALLSNAPPEEWAPRPGES